MSKIYFLNTKGKNVGPFTNLDIRDKIACGDLNENSYIFVKGTKAWVYLKQLDEFSEDLKVVEKNIVKRWYIHKNKENLGPYSINDLIKLIKDGTYDLDDFAWSKGMSSWIPLRTLDELCVNAYDEFESSVKDLPKKEPNIGSENSINKINDEKTSISINSAKNNNYSSKLKNNINQSSEENKENNDEKDNKDNKSKDKKLLKKQNLEQKKLAKEKKAEEKKKKQGDEKVKKTRKQSSRVLVKLVPELIFSIVLFFLGFNLDNKQESMYLIILSIIIFIFFIYINIFRRKKIK